MKAKGRRISHNVERAETFGSKAKYKYAIPKVDKSSKQYTTDSRFPSEHEMKVEALKRAGAPKTKTQKANEAANRLNEYGRVGKIPTPSPRGKQPAPPKGKPLKKTTPYPRIHTSNKTFDKMRDGMSRAVIQPKVDKIAEKIKNAERLEELREKARKRSGKQARPRPKYDKKTGKKL